MSFFSNDGKGLGQQAELKDLSDADFEHFRKLIYEQSGISLNHTKKELLRTRLRGRLVREGYSSYREYFEVVKADKTGQAIVPLLDDISTNLTSFYREINHFHFLSGVMPEWIKRKASARDTIFRIWSAGCSSGEEPYSILFSMIGHLSGLSGWSIKFLATDLSTEILQKATDGLYTVDRLTGVPKNMINEYFEPDQTAKGHDAFRVKREYRQMISFRRFNLMTPHFPFKHQFDFIFCRNVMIYFDRPTQEVLINKYHKVIKPGGYLFIGHSESLTGLNHGFKYIQPTIYQK